MNMNLDVGTYILNSTCDLQTLIARFQADCQLQSGPRPGQYLMKLNVPAKDAKEGWTKFRGYLQPKEALIPLLRIDAEMLLHYPTGDITIVFSAMPTDDELKAFEAEYKLELLRKNEYIKTRIIFRPIQPEATYLPDVINNVQSADEVTRAWLNTLSAYTRCRD